jgi:hypothetical protein
MRNSILKLIMFQLSTNGLITFTIPEPGLFPTLDSSKYPFLAPFWTDLYPLGNDTGTLYYKVYTDSLLLRTANKDVQTYSRINSFKAKWMLVAIWNNTRFSYQVSFTHMIV